jgi:hypothetical protein
MFISGVMWLLGFLASVIVFYAYLVQKFILYVGFALAPIFIGFLAVRTLHSIGVGFLPATYRLRIGSAATQI